MPGRKECCGFGTSFEAKRWLSLDVCGAMGITLSWSVHLNALTVLAVKVISSSVASNMIYYCAYVPVAVLAMISLFQASTTDPGAVPLGAKPFTTVKRAASGELTAVSACPRRGIRRCHKCCDNYKPARAHHDSVTGRCIVKFDHYCPWINNAVGALNHKFFCLFLLYTALSCLLSLVLLVLRMIHCGYNVARQDESENVKGALDAAVGENIMIDTEGGRALLARDIEPITQHFIYPECRNFAGDPFVIALTVASLVFLVFTIAMGCEQMEAIETGKGKIARMQQSVGSRGTEFSKVTEEFNEMFGGNSPSPAWHWYLPIPVRFPRGMKQVILGYEFNETCLPMPYQEPGDSSEDLEAGNNVATEQPPVPLAEGDGLFREISDGSVKNRRSNSRASDDNGDEGITLVERAKTRLS